VIKGLGGEQGLSLAAWYWEEKPGFFHPLFAFSQPLAHLTALPGEKPPGTSQVARAGGGKKVQLKMMLILDSAIFDLISSLDRCSQAKEIYNSGSEHVPGWQC